MTPAGLSPDPWTDTRSSGLAVSIDVEAATSAAAACTDEGRTRGVPMTMVR